MIIGHLLPDRMILISFLPLPLIFSTMLFGVYITASHQGFSCPGWPLCPNGLQFPIPKYFFENLHRLMVLITFIAIIAVTIHSVIKVNKARKTSIAASSIISVQIILGILIINTKLNPLVVAAHLSIGVLLFGMMLITFLSYYNLEKCA